MKSIVINIFAIICFLSGCTANDVVTKEQIAMQNKVDAIVSGLLFDNALDETASYKIKKDGLVVIKFDKSVSEEKYTMVVNLLRSNSSISGVQAEQSGKEVCSFR